MPASSYGFGAAFFRNSSFDKTVKLSLSGKTMSKSKLKNFSNIKSSCPTEQGVRSSFRAWLGW